MPNQEFNNDQLLEGTTMSSSFVPSCTNPLNKMLNYLNSFMKLHRTVQHHTYCCCIRSNSLVENKMWSVLLAVTKHSRYEHGAPRLVGTSEWGLKAFPGSSFLQTVSESWYWISVSCRDQHCSRGSWLPDRFCVLNEWVSGFPSFFCCLVDRFPLGVLELPLDRWVYVD